MNKRIQELAEQACFLNKDEESVEYFAELIVQECAKICSDTAVTNPPNDLFYGYNLGVNKAAENIMMHFGVE